jgi:hypothetical protein
MSVDRFKNDQQAHLAAKADLTAHTAALFNKYAAQAGGDKARLQAEALGQQLSQQVNTYNMQIAQNKAKQEVLGNQGNISSYLGTLPPEEAAKYSARIIKLPTGKEVLAYDAKGAGEVRDQIAGYSPLVKILKRIDEIGPGALMPNSTARKEALSLRSTAIPLMNKIAKLGILSEREHQMLSEQFNDPTKWMELFGGPARTKAYLGNMESMLEAAVSAQAPGYKAPSKPGTAY